jgi:hypothetical protein
MIMGFGSYCESPEKPQISRKKNRLLFVIVDELVEFG